MNAIAADATFARRAGARRAKVVEPPWDVPALERDALPSRGELLAWALLIAGLVVVVWEIAMRPFEESFTPRGVRVASAARAFVVGAAVFAFVTASLGRGMRRTERSVSTLQILAASKLFGVASVRSDGRVLAANEAFLALTGARRVDVDAGRAAVQSPDVREAVADEAALAELRRDGVSAPYEKTIERPDGSVAHALVQLARLPESSTEAIALFVNVTERRRAEEESNRRAAELERSNAELSQFAHVASHDLQEPLRMVASYLQLVERRYKDKLDPEGHEFIAHAVGGARRMQALIEDLLALSRVGAAPRALEATDLRAAFDAAVANLRVAIQEADADVTASEVPTVLGDRGQIDQVLQNLIGNAIKFHRPGVRPVVRVDATRDGDAWTIRVTDNGIGIEPQYHERIFGLFQRLHSRSEYPGTGIGLALVKKIVERHGGRVWLESTPGKGSTFLFTLPALPEAAPDLAIAPKPVDIVDAVAERAEDLV